MKKPTDKFRGPEITTHGVDCDGAVDRACAHKCLIKIELRSALVRLIPRRRALGGRDTFRLQD